MANNKVRLNWAPRVRQPHRPVTTTRHPLPPDPAIFGLPITNDELKARLTGKAY